MSEQPPTDQHVGHKHILGSDAVRTQLLLTQDMIEAESMQNNPAAWPTEWRDNPVADSTDMAEEEALGARIDLMVVEEKAALTTRGHLGKQLASSTNRNLLEAYMDSEETDLPASIKTQAMQVGSPTWSEWLTKDATNEQILNFLQWHNYHMAEVQNDPEIQRRIAAQKEQYKAAIMDAGEQGILPEFSDAEFNSLDSVQIYIGDTFDTLMRGAAGYHKFGAGYVVIAEQSLEDAAFHELNHAWLGDIQHTWLNEALTEHIARSLKVGSFGTIDANGKKAGAYTDERKFVETLAGIIAENNEEYSTAEDVVIGLVQAYQQEGHTNERLKFFDKALQRAFDTQGSVFATLNAELGDRTVENIQEGMELRLAMMHALRTVRSDLLQQPDVIFEQYESAVA